jgi:ubiquinone/menaquinone biosynthesis C-methylase UbiE
MNLVKAAFWKIKKLGDRFLGTASDEFYWKFRHLFDRNWAEDYLSEEALSNTKFITGEIERRIPFSSLLEVGCASGPNLYGLAKKYPEIKFYGIDISRKAIEVGKKIFAKEKISNIFLSEGKAENLEKFKDKSVDLVFSSAVLIYIGPDKIRQVLKEMVRVAKKKIILFEWNSERAEDSLFKAHWVHNYRFLINKFLPPGEKVKITKFPFSKDWSGGWEEFGSIIEVSLQ